MQTLIIDIETSPNLAWVWGLFDQHVAINQIVENSSVICFAARWAGTKKVLFHSDHHDGHEEMIRQAWHLVDEAESIVHYNGRAFDMKHLMREFLLAGMGPPSPHADIDLLQTIRRKFKFPSNKLQHVSKELGIGQKYEHEGFGLWLGCMEGDEQAWKTMARYNRQDVVLTETLYNILLPWIDTHPSVTVRNGRPDACPRCGGTRYQKRGKRYTKVAQYQQWLCLECRGYFSSRKKDEVASPDYK